MTSRGRGRALDVLVGARGRQLLGEVRELQQRRVFVPQGLRHHLRGKKKGGTDTGRMSALGAARDTSRMGMERASEPASKPAKERERKTDRQTERQREREPETHRQTERERARERQRDRETERQRESE